MDDEAAPIGRRVTIRHRTDGTASDVIGRVLRLDDHAVVVERRDGSLVTIARDRIIASRFVPDRPARSRPASAITPDALTAITSRGWPAVQSVPLGDWELRASGGFTGRANSVAMVGDPGRPFDDALAIVTRFYLDRGQRPLAQVVTGSAHAAALAERGWRPPAGERTGAIVQVADLPQAPSFDPSPEVRITTTLDDRWLACYHRVGADTTDAARAVLSGPTTVGFATAGDPAIGIGRVVVTGEWAGIAAVEVLPEHRRAGWARRIVTSCLAWAHERGADKIYLQTMEDNAAALALYRPFGFVTHHTYAYLAPSPGPD